MTSDKQKAGGGNSPRFQRWKGKLRQLTESKSPFTVLREDLEASIAAGSISEFDDVNVVLPKLIDSLDLVEFLMACEELHLDDSWGTAYTVREFLWVLKKLEIEDKRRHGL